MDFLDSISIKSFSIKALENNSSKFLLFSFYSTLVHIKHCILLMEAEHEFLVEIPLKSMSGSVFLVGGCFSWSTQAKCVSQCCLSNFGFF